MADELNTLVLNLDSGGDVVIKLRPDLAPAACRADHASWPRKAFTTASSSTA